MVIYVVVEGGVIGKDPTKTDQENAEIWHKTAALRQALHVFFVQALNNENVDIRIIAGSGWKQAVNTFISQQGNKYLYVDLDAPPEKRNDW